MSVTGFPHHHQEEQVALRPHRTLARLATDAETTSDSQPGTTDAALACAARVHLCTDAGKTREIAPLHATFWGGPERFSRGSHFATCHFIVMRSDLSFCPR